MSSVLIINIALALTLAAPSFAHNDSVNTGICPSDAELTSLGWDISNSSEVEVNGDIYRFIPHISDGRALQQLKRTFPTGSTDAAVLEALGLDFYCEVTESEVAVTS
jgi:hypothetical protein